MTNSFAVSYEKQVTSTRRGISSGECREGGGIIHSTIRLVELISGIYDPVFGEHQGICCFCGQQTFRGHLIELSENFMNANLLQDGSVICEFCQPLKSSKEFRNSMWIATRDGVRFFKRDEAKDILLAPPEPPFAIFLTRSYKKPGWQMMCARDAVAESREIFPVGFDYDIIVLDRSRFSADIALIDQLRQRGLSKSEIEAGRLRIPTVRKLGVSAARELLSTFGHRVGDPSWSLALYVA